MAASFFFAVTDLLPCIRTPICPPAASFEEATARVTALIM